MSDAAENPSRQPVTREDLYTLVWSEPMLRVAARYEVSSSYMARVCTSLNVPRPERGYWAKLAVGKAPARPLLPEAGPGDLLDWVPGGESAFPGRPVPRPRHVTRTNAKPKRQADPTQEQHRLLLGAKSLFEAGRESWTVGYLKPSKRLLVDLIATKSGLEKALNLANRLFIALENDGHIVDFFAPGMHYHRAEVDFREKPSKSPSHENLWSPNRGTAVSIHGTVFGLTIVEIAEEVEVRYVNGKYVRLTEYEPPKRRRYQVDSGWTSRRDMPSGRMCLQAYSPYLGTTWIRTWRESEAKELTAFIPAIIRDLRGAVPEIARQVEAAEQESQRRQKEWDEQKARWDREREEQRVAKALKDSTEELIAVIEEWSAAKRLADFFDTARREIETLPAEKRDRLIDRLQRAQKLVAGPNPLERLRSWKTPEERKESDSHGGWP